MSILSAVSNLMNTQVVSDSYRGSGSYYFGMGQGGSDLLVSEGNNWFMDAYIKCPPVGSIISRKAEMLLNGENWILDRSGSNSGKVSTTDAAKKLRKLMSQPNPLQNWSQFEAQLATYYQIYGYCLILPIYPVGWKQKEDITRLWIIPPFMVDIEETEKVWYATDGQGLVRRIVLKSGSEDAELNFDDLLMINDFTPNESSMVFPGSRLTGVKYPIATVMQGFMSIKNGMRNTPLGILGNDTKDSMSFIPLQPDEKLRIENELRTKGLGDRQQSIIVSNANLKWNPINYPIGSLNLPEHIKIAVEAISDRLGYYFELLSNSQGTTFSNKREAHKATIQDFVIPMAKSIYEQLNNFFGTEKLNIIIDKDFSNLPILQEDAESKAKARKIGNEAYLIEFENDLITVNRWLELNAENTRGTEGEMYYSEWVKLHPEILKVRTASANSNSNNND